jgi:hypothetical protein
MKNQQRLISALSDLPIPLPMGDNWFKRTISCVYSESSSIHAMDEFTIHFRVSEIYPFNPKIV